MSSFEINATRVPEGTNHYSFATKASDLGLSASFSALVRLEVDIERRGRQFLVDGSVETAGQFTCDRCLAGFEKEMESGFRVLFTPDGVAQTPGQENDEVRTIPADTMIIELDDEVRQCVELAIPPKLLCEEQCKGLCPQCGKNLNNGTCTCENDDTDPRWEPLRKLSRS